MKLPWYMKSDDGINITFHWLWVLYQIIKYKLKAMKTRTSLIIIFTIGLVFSIGIAIVDGYWGFDSTVTISSAAFICLVIIVVNKIKK